MKKKFLIGALGLASLFTMMSATTNDEGSEEGRRRFWGWGSATPEYVDGCTATSIAPDGTQQCSCTAHYTYYVMWIGFEQTEPWNGSCR